jgi:hypothetical protein
VAGDRAQDIDPRTAFWVSVHVLMAVWIGFAIDIAGAQTAYDAAMDNMTI